MTAGDGGSMGDFTARMGSQLPPHSVVEAVFTGRVSAYPIACLPLKRWPLASERCLRSGLGEGCMN